MRIEHISTVKFKEIPKQTIHFTPKVRTYCQMAYPDHPQGCPNYNQSPLCPPQSPYLENVIVGDASKYQFFYLLYIDIDFQRYKDQMLKEHPHWSDRQLNNVLYWQNQAKKILKDHLAYISPKDYELLGFGSGFGETCYSMESVGINVISTMLKNDIPIQARPTTNRILTCLLYATHPLTYQKPKKATALTQFFSK